MLILNPSPGTIRLLSQPIIEPPLFDPVYVSLTLLLNHPLKRFASLFSLLRIHFSSLALVVGIGVRPAVTLCKAASGVATVTTVSPIILRINLGLASTAGGLCWGLFAFLAPAAFVGVGP
ncbi:hypothetical protein E4J66_14185 [Actinomyces viscosus]|nr:hypothetical protein E4J66_14185 [Actinomyces viscosus]